MNKTAKSDVTSIDQWQHSSDEYGNTQVSPTFTSSHAMVRERQQWLSRFFYFVTPNGIYHLPWPTLKLNKLRKQSRLQNRPSKRKKRLQVSSFKIFNKKLQISRSSRADDNRLVWTPSTQCPVQKCSCSSEVLGVRLSQTLEGSVIFRLIDLFLFFLRRN